MFIVTNGTLAVLLCIVTMLCWGSWGNSLPERLGVMNCSIGTIALASCCSPFYWALL